MSAAELRARWITALQLRRIDRKRSPATTAASTQHALLSNLYPVKQSRCRQDVFGDGYLSPLLASSVYCVAWLSDSERLLFARSRQVSTFADISAALTPERTRKVVASAEEAWLHIQAPDWSRNAGISPNS